MSEHQEVFVAGYKVICADLVCRRLYEVARTYGLSSCDAAYLELAIRVDGGLATLDKELIAAADACGVITHPM